MEYIIDALAARHTITVELLAHLARTNNWTVEELREKLEKNGFQLEYMDEEDKLVNIQKSYETLYDMSVLTEAEQSILEAFSVFPYIPLKAEICNQWLLGDAGVGEKDYVLMKLYQKGWLQFDMEQESYSMHPVFAQFIYEKNRPEFEKHAGLIKAYREAEELYKKSLRIRERVLGEEHPNTATSYNNLATVYFSQRKYEHALSYIIKAYKILISKLGFEHPKTKIFRENMEIAYAEWNPEGDFEQWLEEQMKEPEHN